MLVMSGGTRGSSASAPRVTSTGVSLDQIALRDLDDSSCRILVRAQWGRVLQFSCVASWRRRCELVLGGSALALLVAQVLADHHDSAVAANHLALVTDLLDARLNLHLPAVLSIALSTHRHAATMRTQRGERELG